MGDTVDYANFVKTKERLRVDSGFDIDIDQLNPNLFDWQKVIVKWALGKGKAAIFASCGMGKTLVQLEWANQVHIKTSGDVLILAPLAVSKQTVREGMKFGIDVNICRSQDDWKPGINITNYEKLEHFDITIPVGIVLDESSILKSLSGKIRTHIIDMFKDTPYKLACSATPAPNDSMELGNHAEFLNVMSRSEMLATYFIHDGSDTSKWRLKGHVKENLFWNWMCSWAIMLEKPSDIGFSDEKYELPELRMHEHFVKSPLRPGEMFVTEATDLISRRNARKESIDDRVAMANDIIDHSMVSPWLCWCNLNDESAKLKKVIKDSVEVTGSNKDSYKEKTITDFANGHTECLISKPKICGHGLNFQICSNMIFVGLSDSFEAMYQATRRCWRFGQKNPVDVHIVLSEREGSILNNIKQKEAAHQKMITGMVENMSDITKKTLRKEGTSDVSSTIKKHTGRDWTLYHGDCVAVAKEQPENSIDYTIFSPPFASLYTYSDSYLDMGNSKSDGDFMHHFKYLIDEMYRITKPGRLVSVHCMDLPAMKERDGYIGLKDFSGELVCNMQESGFVYHSRVMIFKDPLIEAVRTKSLGLMHKQIQKDSSRCRQGLPDYILTFVKPGINMEVIDHPDGFTRFIGNNEPTETGIKYSHNVWRRYASPVWTDINQSNTLNVKLARDGKDERHICPMNLEVIGRCLELWSNPNDLVFSPFTGIGSEGYVSLQMDRKFIGAELKESYANVAINNLTGVSSSNQLSLFG